VNITQDIFNRALEVTTVGTGSDPFQRYLKTDEGSEWKKFTRSDVDAFTRMNGGIPIPDWIVHRQWIKVT
jgi:hypothetical protein